MAASELDETNGEDRGARECTPITPEFCRSLGMEALSLIKGDQIVVTCYIKCPLKMLKHAYTRDAIYHQTKATALQIYNLGL